MYVIPPSKTTKKELKNMFQKVLQNFEKEGFKLVNVSLLWMPYYTVECSYQDKYGFTEHSETTMNAMLYSDALEGKDIIFLFRPNFLQYKPKKREKVHLNNVLGKYREVKGPATKVDFQKISRKVSEFMENVKDRLTDLRSKVKFEYESGITRLFTGSRHALERLSSRFLREGLKDMEKEVAYLSSMEILTKIFLNLRSLPQDLEMRKKQEFYFPYLTMYLERKEKEPHEKFCFIGLVKVGRLLKKFREDTLLTRITEKYNELNQLMKSLVIY